MGVELKRIGLLFPERIQGNKFFYEEYMNLFSDNRFFILVQDENENIDLYIENQDGELVYRIDIMDFLTKEKDYKIKEISTIPLEYSKSINPNHDLYSFDGKKFLVKREKLNQFFNNFGEISYVEDIFFDIKSEFYFEMLETEMYSSVEKFEREIIYSQNEIESSIEEKKDLTENKLCDTINHKEKTTKNEKGCDSMFNNINEGKELNQFHIGEMEFGMVESDLFNTGMDFASGKMLLAIKSNSGQYVMYNKDSNELVDASEMLMDINMVFKMPKPFSQVKVGDLIKREGQPMYVQSIQNGSLTCLNVEGEIKTFIPIKNQFFRDGFVVCYQSMMENNGMFGQQNIKPDPENPFASIFSNPWMFMCMGQKDGKGEGMGGIMKAMAMSQMFSGFAQPQLEQPQPQDDKDTRIKELEALLEEAKKDKE